MNGEPSVPGLTGGGVSVLMSAATPERYRRDGYVVVERGIDPELCQVTIDRLRGAELIQVTKQTRTDATRFLTLNGADLLARVPLLGQMYEALAPRVSQVVGTPVAPLDNTAVGVSLNYTPAGGQFVRHFDRNAFTVSLYLNEVAGGDLQIWPNAVSPTLEKLGVRGRSLAVRLTRLRRPISIPPRPGTLVVFSRRCVHAVDPVVGDKCRVSVIMAYDAPGVSFADDRDYYGRGSNRVVLDRVNA